MYIYIYIYIFLAVRQIGREKIHFVRELGEGAFGRVYLGLCEGLHPGEDLTMIAVKTLKVRPINQNNTFDFDFSYSF